MGPTRSVKQRSSVVTVFREAVPLLSICAGGLAAKIALMLTSQRTLDGDEAIVGLMARHVQQGLSHPLFFYGQSYDAGAGVLAHVAGLSQGNGVSVLSLKIVALILWLGMTAMAAHVVGSWVGWRAAAWTVALIVWAPTSVEWATKARGGHMLALSFVLIALASGMRGSSPLTIGGCAAAAVWCQPSSLPVVAIVCSWMAVRWIRKRQWADAVVMAGAVVAVSIGPVLVLQSTSTSWSWQAFAGADTQRHPLLLFGTILPGLFTPNLDWSIPPAAAWVQAIGVLWLVVAVGTCAIAVAAIRRNWAPAHLRRPLAMLLAATAAAATAMFILDTRYVRPRVLLPLYPLACMTMAAVLASWRQRTGAIVPLLILGSLIVSGVAVHAASLGPPQVHGAGDQERRLPASIVDAMVADLDRHHVRCVFSESPTLQWNLIFSSRERIAARWITASDRWQPYVERVNAAFLAGERCALLLRTWPGDQRIASLRTHLGEHSDQLTVWDERLALLYDPPRSVITRVFARDGGW